MLKVFSWLGIGLGILSGFMLLKQGIDFGLTAPFVLMLDWYHAGVELVGSLLQPFVQGVLWILEYLVGWKLELYPHWKHLLVTSLGFGLAFTRAALAAQMGGRALPLVLPVVSAAVGLFAGTHKLNAGVLTAAFGIDPTADRAIVLGLLTLVFSAFIWTISFGLSEDRDRLRAGAIAAAAVPIGVILLIVTNAGLRLIPGL